MLKGQWRQLDDLMIGRDLPAWVVSLAIHVLLLVVISLLTFAIPNPFQLTVSMEEVVPLEDLPEEFRFQENASVALGARSEDGLAVAMASAPEVELIEDLTQSPDLDIVESGDVQFVDDVELATTQLNTNTKLVRGVAGVGVTGAEGAIDRLTAEILESLEDRDTLVAWLFDQSASLATQREQIRERLSRIYEELGIIIDDRLKPTSNHHPLLTTVVAFGERSSWMIEKPTSDVAAIREAINNVALDESGTENVFSAIISTATELKRWKSKRNIMLIVVSDEVGDDQVLLEKAVDLCRKQVMPVYVLGVPAAFGQAETQLKWIDPDPKFDQQVRWGRVSQGPESLLPELLHLPFGSGIREVIDSGFGPFALTRLCFQTGGIYFAIHPNRRVGRRVRRREIDAYTSHMAYFFDPQRIRPYRPEYVSANEYKRRAKSNHARSALLTAAAMTINRLSSPALRFVKQDEAQFANLLTDAQKDAAKLEPKLNSLFEILKRGEEHRQQEETLRWQAAYDLAYGQSLAVLVRTRAYNEMLAKAKRGLEPENEKTNTWLLVPDDELSTSSRLEKNAAHAREYLSRVAEDHKGTPWALIAQRELATPMGWKWTESYTPIAARQNNMRPANNNAPNPRDDRKRMIPKGPPKRAVPKL